MRSTIKSVFDPKRVTVAVAAIWLAIAIPLNADDTQPGKELLKPTDQKAAHAVHKISYKLSNGSDGWDSDARDRIVKAMDQAVIIYNENGDFDRVLTANWNPGTPTADANFGGWINFGGQIGTRTALHEIAHTLGIGTAPKWRNFARDGKWTGEYGIAQLKEFDGPNAVLHCDNQHFWPYGLNYDKEGGKENFKRNVLMVTAMRADMGLGPPPHPAALALKNDRVAAAESHVLVDKTQTALNLLQTQLQSGLASRPEVLSASNAVTATKATYDAAVTAAIESFRKTDEYKTAAATAAEAGTKLDAIQDDPTATQQDRATAAESALNARSALTHLQAKRLDSTPEVVDAKKGYESAVAALHSAREAPLKNDSQLLANKQALAAAKEKASAADQTVATAILAAAKEQNTLGKSTTGK